MGRVTHFDINAKDPERAAEFYRNAFGWAVEPFDGPLDYWMIRTGDKEEQGIDGGIGKGPEGPAVTNFIRVDDIDQAARMIVAAGGTLTTSRTAIPTVGWMVTFQDTEGNTFGAMQMDPAAG